MVAHFHRDGSALPSRWSWPGAGGCMGPPLLRRPAPDQGTEALCERVMKGYFKTHCDQAYGGRRRCCERSVHGPDAGQARCRTGFFPFLGGRPPQGRPAQDLARGAQKSIYVYIYSIYIHI